MTHKKILEKFLKIKQENNIHLTCDYCGQKVEPKSTSSKYHRIYLECNHYINPLKGTPLYKTRISLRKWWSFLVAYKENTLTSSMAGKILNISTYGAWKILKKIRSCKFENKLSGDVFMIDESFLGSSKKNHHKQKLSSEELEEYDKIRDFKPRKRNETYKEKSVIYGIVDKNGVNKLYDSGFKATNMPELKGISVKHPEKNSSLSFMHYYWFHLLRINNIEKGSIIVHDGDKVLDKCLIENGYSTRINRHSRHEYVTIDKVDKKIYSTNSVEGTFGRFKRKFKGVQTHTKRWLHLYLDEYCFRTRCRNKSMSTLISILCKV